jgi:hypothetical protein
MTDPTRPYSNDTSQQEREEVLRNDARKPYSPRREYEPEPTTFSRFARSQANEVGGRFREVEKATVVGVEQPDLPAPDWANDPSGVERPLGYRIDEMEAVGEPHEIEKSLGDPAQGNPRLDSARHPGVGAGSSPSQLGEPTPGFSHSPAPPRTSRGCAGSLAGSDASASSFPASGALDPTTEDVVSPRPSQSKLKLKRRP